MIEEIIKLRGDGLSFQKIASELNTTVGRVQYRWNKWMKIKEKGFNDQLPVPNSEKKDSMDGQIPFAPIKGELQAKLVSPQKIILIWGASALPQKIIQLFFNQQFEELIHVVRVYDVTDIVFNGKNAHHFYELAVSFQNSYWFIKGLLSNRDYVAEIGVKFSENSFFPILRSNSIQTPRIEGDNGDERYHHLLQLQSIENHPPKWTEHVSTYSYYAESKTMEGNNG